MSKMDDKALLILASLTYRDSNQIIKGLKRLHWRILFNIYIHKDAITIGQLIMMLGFQKQSKHKIISCCQELKGKNLIYYSEKGKQINHMAAINDFGARAVNDYIIMLQTWIIENYPQKTVKPSPV